MSGHEHVRFHAIDAEPGDDDSVRLVRCAGADCGICLADDLVAIETEIGCETYPSATRELTGAKGSR